MSDTTTSKAGIGGSEATESGVRSAEAETGIAETGARESRVLGKRRVDSGGENQIIEAGIHEVRVKARVLEVSVEAGILKVSIEAGILKIEIKPGIGERPEGTASAKATATEATPAGK